MNKWPQEKITKKGTFDRRTRFGKILIENSIQTIGLDKKQQKCYTGEQLKA